MRNVCCTLFYVCDHIHFTPFFQSILPSFMPCCSVWFPSSDKDKQLYCVNYLFFAWAVNVILTSLRLSTCLPSWEQRYLQMKLSSAREVDAIRSVSDRKSVYSVIKKEKAEPSGPIMGHPIQNKTIQNFSVHFPNKVMLSSFLSFWIVQYVPGQEKQSISEQIICLNKDRNSQWGEPFRKILYTCDQTPRKSSDSEVQTFKPQVCPLHRSKVKEKPFSIRNKEV